MDFSDCIYKPDNVNQNFTMCWTQFGFVADPFSDCKKTCWCSNLLPFYFLQQLLDLKNICNWDTIYVITKLIAVNKNRNFLPAANFNFQTNYTSEHPSMLYLIIFWVVENQPKRYMRHETDKMSNFIDILSNLLMKISGYKLYNS